jgi:hypothetical protein
MDVILIPAYEPDKELIKLVDKLTESQFPIVVVDALLFVIVQSHEDLVPDKVGF